MQRIRVILAAHGEAESAGLTENFQVGRRTLGHAAEVMRLPAPLRLAICAAAAVRKRLAGGSGSPHNANTRQQAAALEQVLQADATASYHVEAAFASALPCLDDVVGTPGDADQQLLLSMIPTDSRLSCGLICHPLLATSAATRARTTVMARLWDAPELIAIHCAHIAEHFPRLDPAKSNCLALILHGTVMRDERGRTPDYHTGAAEKTAYAEALRAALLAVPERPWQRVAIAYLNHGVGGEWSSPTLPELLSELGAAGVDSVVGYACEHLVDGGETVDLPTVLAAGPVPETHRLPCLNASPAFIEFLAARVRAAAAAAPGTTLCCAPCPLLQDRPP
ncbi:MAG: ferrochelatase [Gammaproteobacteria bacterium]|jgi:ferrochelatase|nr:ferrochelatase [Gammaproteobacteria bacterium]